MLAQGLTNFLFGFFIQKGRVYEPRLIQDQMLFKDFSMLTMFLAAAGTTALIVALSAHMKGTWGDRIRLVRSNLVKRQIVRGILSVAVGAGMVGSGMGISGACPGTLYSQIGAGVSGSMITFIGGILGTLTYFIIEPFLNRNLFSKMIVKDQNAVLPFSFQTTATILAGLLLSASTYLHFNAPVSKPVYPKTTNPLFLPAWDPIISGILIGLLQIPSLIFTNSPIGMSSYLIATTAILRYPLLKLHILPANSDPLNWSTFTSLQKLFDIGTVILGSFVSSWISGTFSTVPGLTSEITEMQHPYLFATETTAGVQAFVGGVLLLLGARIAGGCTSGHGLSGFPFLGINSVVAVPAIFAGGIVSVQVLKAFAAV